MEDHGGRGHGAQGVYVSACHSKGTATSAGAASASSEVGYGERQDSRRTNRVKWRTERYLLSHGDGQCCLTQNWPFTGFPAVMLSIYCILFGIVCDKSRLHNVHVIIQLQCLALAGISFQKTCVSSGHRSHLWHNCQNKGIESNWVSQMKRNKLPPLCESVF